MTISAKKVKFIEREQRILDSALSLLLELPEERVTVEMIAEKAGIGKGTVYKHFSSKTEIYVALLINYESEVTDKLMSGVSKSKAGNPEAAARVYFEGRMADPAKDLLFQRLEEKITALNLEESGIEKLHNIRRSNQRALIAWTQEQIDAGKLRDVPAEYHILAGWALAQGAIELYHSKFFDEHIDDREALMKFITEVGVTMGNRSHFKD